MEHVVNSKYTQIKSGRAKECYVYLHLRPNGTPFYIGIGRGRRCENMDSRSLYHRRVVAKIRRAGGEPSIIIDRVCSPEEAQVREKDLIAEYGRVDQGTGILVNHSPGGEFIPEKGRVRSSQVLKGNKNRLGTKQSEETKRKIGEAARELWQNEEHRENIRQKMMGNKHGEANKGKPSYVRTPETLSKLSASRKGKEAPWMRGPRSDEVRAKMREGQARRYAVARRKKAESLLSKADLMEIEIAELRAQAQQILQNTPELDESVCAPAKKPRPRVNSQGVEYFSVTRAEYILQMNGCSSEEAASIVNSRTTPCAPSTNIRRKIVST